MSREPLPQAALDQLFLSARTANAWLDQPVPEATLRRLYDLTKFGPTSANASPARFVFVTTAEGKARLLPLLSEGNRAKTAQAPVCCIVAHDPAFAEQLPRLFPHDLTASSWFAAPAVAEATAFRNGTLQGAYLILAARALGLDCGPMSGFDAAGVEREFLAADGWKPNFLCSLGYGDFTDAFDRLPRLLFDDACRVV